MSRLVTWRLLHWNSARFECSYGTLLKKSFNSFWSNYLEQKKIAGDFRLKKPRFHAAVVSSYRGLMVIGGKTSSTEILVYDNFNIILYFLEMGILLTDHACRYPSGMPELCRFTEMFIFLVDLIIIRIRNFQEEFYFDYWKLYYIF